jgi:hypothetical protein
MDPRRIEKRDGCIVLAYEQLDLRAAEDDALRVAIDEGRHDLEVGIPGLLPDLAEDEFVVNHVVYERPPRLIGDQDFEAVPLRETTTIRTAAPSCSGFRAGQPT